MLEFLQTLAPEWRCGLLVLFLLVTTTTIVAALKRAKPQSDFSELAARTRSWWFMAGAFFAALALGGNSTVIFFALTSFWALKEYFTLLDTRPSDHGALVLAFLAVPLQFFWVASEWYAMFLIFVPLYVFLLLPIRLVLAGDTQDFTTSVSRIHWGLMAFVFGLSHLAYLTNAECAPGTGADGRTLLLFLVFVVEASDVFQYVWGKLYGKHAVLPKVSPNKTWEGLVGGIATTAVMSLAIRFLTPFTILETVGIVVLVTLMGFFGGAVMSAVKRDFGVKDFGRTIPGHGGVLDRVDSLVFAAPIYFHVVWYFEYVSL